MGGGNVRSIDRSQMACAHFVPLVAIFSTLLTTTIQIQIQIQIQILFISPKLVHGIHRKELVGKWVRETPIKTAERSRWHRSHPSNILFVIPVKNQLASWNI